MNRNPSEINQNDLSPEDCAGNDSSVEDEATLPPSDGQRPKLNIKFKNRLDRPSSSHAADKTDTPDDDQDDEARRSYRLIEPTFKANADELAAAREVVAHRQYRRGCRGKILFGVVALSLLGVTGWWLATWRSGVVDEETSRPSELAGEGEALVELVNDSPSAVTVRIGETVVAVPIGQSQRLVVSRGRHEVGWTSDDHGRPFYNAIPDAEIESDERWVFAVAGADGKPILKRSGVNDR